MPRNVQNLRAALWSTLLGFGLLATGCGDDLPARTGDEPLPCEAVTTTYGIDHADLSAVVAQEIDLDGDHRPDDALGRAHDLLTAFAPDFDVSGRFGDRLATDIAWNIRVDQCNGHVRVGIGPTDTGLPHAAGAVLGNGELTAEDGQAQLPLLALADASGTTSDPGWRVGDAVTIKATLAGDSLDGVFAMAVPTAMVRAELAAPITAFLDAQPVDNALRAATDLDHDGVVTAAEVTATSTYDAMTQSDLELTIDGEPQTSIAFRFHATALR